MKLPSSAIKFTLRGKMVVALTGDVTEYSKFGKLIPVNYCTYPPTLAGYDLHLDEDKYVVVGDEIVERLDGVNLGS